MKKLLLFILALLIFCASTLGIYLYFKKKDDSVNIVFAIDNKYVVPCVVAISSIQRNKKETTDLNIYVLGHDLSEENKALFTGMGVHLMEHKTHLPEFEKTHTWVSSTALTKFYLPDIFPDKNKILYLDADIIVQGDLKELYQTDLSNHYAAVVKGLAETIFAKAHERLGLKGYFNSGIMLLNLEKMRKDKVTEQLVKWKIKNDEKHFMDQDAFNTVFKENVVFLPPKYNFMAPTFIKSTTDEIKQFYGINEEPVMENAVIVHLLDTPKAWTHKIAVGHKLWKKNYNLSPLGHIKRSYY
ncbi:MAG: glycosyltransferase family 8 protein [Alphaproteobacteria bacterium]|nr:glycosyltransferase family 8 protein [Alphaproteobacteria bacterium]